MAEIEELVLNNPLPKFKLFYGQNIKQIPKIFKDIDYREIATVPQIVEMKNESFYSSDKKFKDSWWNSYFDTADAIVYGPDGILVVKNPLLLRTFVPHLDPKRDLIDGGLKLSQEQYDSLQGEKISGKELKKYTRCHLESDLMSAEEVLDDKIWNYLFKEKLDLLKEHTEIVFKGEKKNAMRIVVQPYSEDVPVLRLFSIRGNTSDLYGTYRLDEDRGKLVGVLEELSRRELYKGIIQQTELMKEIKEEMKAATNRIRDLEPTSHC